MTLCGVGSPCHSLLVIVCHDFVEKKTHQRTSGLYSGGFHGLRPMAEPRGFFWIGLPLLICSYNSILLWCLLQCFPALFYLGPFFILFLFFDDLGKASASITYFLKESVPRFIDCLYCFLGFLALIFAQYSF